MPKTSRVPFKERTNTVNMPRAKTGMPNNSKIATKTRNIAKKSKATESEGHIVKDAEKLDKNAIKTTFESSPNKPETSISKKVYKSTNLPIGKTRLTRRMAKNNAAEKNLKTTRKPIEKSETKSSPNKPENKPDLAPIYKKTDSGPVYKNKIPKLLSQDQQQTEDPYEFTDLTPPQAKKVNKKRSIIFDKDMDEIMQKLERKEAKAKKRVQTKKKPKKLAGKSYDKIVGDIVLNVMQKITKKQRENPLINKMDKTNIDNAVEFINSHVTSTNIPEIQELPSTSAANILQNVAVRKPVPKCTILSNEILTNGSIVLELAQNSIVNKDLPSPSTANRLQNIAARKPVPKCSIFSNKLLTASATVPEIAHNSIVSNYLPTTSTTNSDQSTLNKQVPKTSITSLRKNLPTTSTPTSKLCDKSVNYDDINSCFGFDDDDLLPIANSSNPLDETLGSALEFNAQIPKANSTMVSVQYNSRPSRAEGPRMKYFYCKNNGLPSGNQQVFIDHTIAEAFERTPSKTPMRQETPSKRPAVQKSILDYVDHSIDENNALEGTLYNIEEFRSPKKKKEVIHNENVNVAKRNILFTKRKPLGDISNSSEETTFYGSGTSPRKTFKNHNVSDENAKPFRFDPNLLKVYIKKKGDNQRQKEPVAEQESISIMENSTESVADVDLFEDPEEVLDHMPVEIHLKKSKRKRYNNSGEIDCHQKRKAKKVKLDANAECWIQQFNEMCHEIEEHQLNIE